MTKAEKKQALIKNLKRLESDEDTERGHVLADQLIIDYIGDEDISAAYHAINKWYA